MDVTCVIPVYKTEKYLPDLLDSINELEGLDQIKTRFIFVNDCSPQNEVDVIKNWVIETEESKKTKEYYEVHIVENYKNYGLAGARNSGFQYEKNLDNKAKYYIWMDSDDVFTPDSIKTRFEFMEQNPDIGFAYGSYYTFRGDFTEACQAQKDHDPQTTWGDPKLKEFDYFRLFNENILSSCGGIIKAEDFTWFDQSIRICEDYDFNLRMALKIKFKLIPNFYAFYYRLRDKCEDLSLSNDPIEQKFHYINNTNMRRKILRILKSQGVSDEIAEFNKVKGF